MNAEWFYSSGEERRGPVSETELRRLADNGELRPTDLVWRDGMADWVEARTQAAFFPPASEPRRPSEVINRIDDDERPSRRPRGDTEDDERPSRRSRRDPDIDDDDRPSARRRQTRYDEDDEYETPRRPKTKPGQVQAIGIMLLVGGIYALLWSLGFVIGSMGGCCLWPGTYFALVWGILAIIRGANIMNQDDQGPPRAMAIMQIIMIVNGDVVNCVLGIVCLVMMSDQNARDYYHRKGFEA